MIQTCCELPKCMLDREDELNDFDFVLYHQYLKDEVYRKHYLEKRIKNPKRKMILDNSAYEFFVSGEEFNENDFIKVINELNPDYYIVPDVLMDKEKTLQNFYHWIKIVPYIRNSEPYFVPQGRTYCEFAECTKEMDKKIFENNLPKRFCIPFHNDFFADGTLFDYKLSCYFFGENPTKDEQYAAGRMILMRKLISEYPSYKFHMLGSHNPKEIFFYNEFYPEIESFDSGYPVKFAIEGIKMNEEKSKPNIIIDDFYNQELAKETQDLIVDNIITMKDYRFNDNYLAKK